jgi:hypothetical protein
VLRARLAGPLPGIREAAGKSETVIKLITHAPWISSYSLMTPHYTKAGDQRQARCAEITYKLLL